MGNPIGGSESIVSHVDFLRNEAGDSLARTMALLLHAPLLTILTAFVTTRVGRSRSWIRVGIEFGLFTCPMMFLMTSLSEHVIISSLMLSFLVLSVSFLHYEEAKSSGSSLSKENDAPTEKEHEKIELLYISWFKGAVVCVTSIAILAVDFQVFPRTSAKTDKFGVSFMDLGASLFVISSALTSAWSRDGNYGTANARHRKGSPKKRWMILALGFSRLVAVKLLEYPEIVDEYGVHWNFFMTLAGLWFLCDVLHRFIVSPLFIVTVACGIVVSYQWVLLNTELSLFILEAQRDTGFFAANREGIIAMMVGYFPMHLLVELFSREFIFVVIGKSRRKYPPKKAEIGDRPLLISLLLLTGVLWTMWYFSHRFIQITSRRLMNTAFVMFALASAASILASFNAAKVLLSFCLKDPGDAILATGGYLQVANEFSLELFLLANLCTGGVNMTWSAHQMDDYSACTLLLCYCGILHLPCGVFRSTQSSAVMNTVHS